MPQTRAKAAAHPESHRIRTRVVEVEEPGRHTHLAALNRELDKYTAWCHSRRRRKALGWRTADQYLADYHQAQRDHRQNQPVPNPAEKLIAPLSQAA